MLPLGAMLPLASVDCIGGDAALAPTIMVA
jgi:hypothetical protein